MTNIIFNLSGKELARDISRGAPLLRHPKPTDPRKGARWIQQLNNLHQKTLLLADLFKAGDQIPMDLLQRASNRVDKISQMIPGGWLFDSKERCIIKAMKKTIAPLLTPEAYLLQKPAEERSFAIPTFKWSAMGAFLIPLYLFGCFVTPTEAAPTTISFPPIKARDLCQQSNMREICSGNLGIPRENMPQLDGEVLSNFLQYKSDQGTWIEMRRIAADKLIPTQRELNRELVFRFLKQTGSFDSSRSPVLVYKNSTGHFAIADGHHRAVATRLRGKDQTAIIVHDDDVLRELRHFPGVKSLPMNEDLSRFNDVQQPPKKYLVMDYPGSKSGMFSTLISTLGVLAKFQKGVKEYTGLEINYGNLGVYYDPNRGDNWWNYYFEPVQIGKTDGEPAFLTKTDRRQSAQWVELDYENSGQRMPRELGQAIINKHIKVKPEIQKQVDDFVRQKFKGKYVIGIHYRGTDKTANSRFAEAPKVPYSEMAKQIRDQIKERNLKNFKIFVATDETAFTQFLEAEFPGRVVKTDIERSNNERPLHLGAKDPYRAGESALIDCLLLAKGNVIIRTSSNLSLFSTYINSTIPVVEVSQRL